MFQEQLMNLITDNMFGIPKKRKETTVNKIDYMVDIPVLTILPAEEGRVTHPLVLNSKAVELTGATGDHTLAFALENRVSLAVTTEAHNRKYFLPLGKNRYYKGLVAYSSIYVAHLREVFGAGSDEFLHLQLNKAETVDGVQLYNLVAISNAFNEILALNPGKLSMEEVADMSNN